MRNRGFAVLFLVLALGLGSNAVTPQFWENFTQEELLKGTLTRVSLGADGRLSLAPAYDQLYDTGQPYTFSMVRDKAGNLYVGTGHEGKVFKIDPRGTGSLYFQAKELDVFALALDASDTLYAGTSPDGKVYKITAANQSSELCNPEDKYIWSLAFDEGGNLYVGTGGRGLIYKVDRTGKKSTFYDSDDNHIVALARDSSGNLLAGTSPGGLVLQINPQGKAFTLLDSTMEEIRSLSQDRFGTIYAVASSSKGLSAPASARVDIPAETGGVLPIVTIQALAAIGSKEGRSTTTTAAAADKETASTKSAIYAIARDGSAETLFTSREQMVYDALVRPDGSILAATGGKGRILSIDTAKQVTVVTDSPEEQMTRLVAADGDVLVAGSNQGRIYRLQSQRAQTGTFESRVLDAKNVASWGKIAWRVASPGGTTVELASRSGNTERPDSTWSDWSAAYSTAAGEQITSPRARYFQWRAAYKRGSGSGAGDALERVRIAYLQQNLRPQVTSITLLPPGVALQKTPSIPTGTLSVGVSGTDGVPVNSPRERGKEKQPLPPRQIAQPGAQAFTWKAADDNDDALEYAVYFKGEGESDWKVLEKRTLETFYTIEAGALPDGVYSVKVLASDAPSNPYGKSLIGELVSKPFVISSGTPQVEVLGHKVSGRRVDLQFKARVPVGRVGSAEFAVDGGEWFLVFPLDGICDSAQEEFQVTTPELTSGEHALGLRATDATGSTGTAKFLVKIP